MLYAPIHGLRILLIESSTLLAVYAVVYLGLRVGCGQFRRPRWLGWVLARKKRTVFVVVALALLARAMLFPWVGVPQPRVNDEYSYLLMADTFAHHRLTNPTPEAWRHFETFHVNLRPTYHSKYPVAQGLVLAFGQVAFHQPWIGVYLSTALLCGAICWALLAFVPPGWALLGGVLAVVRLGLFSYWMNSYWGGSAAALGGALTLGAVVRLFKASNSPRARLLLSCAFAMGLLILATSRPYEGLAFSLPLLVFFGYRVFRGGVSSRARLQILLPVVIIGVAGLLAMAHYNHATTGDGLLMPYALNYRTYWPLPYFHGQKPNSGIQVTDPVYAKFYKMTEEEYGYKESGTVSGLLSVESRRAAEDWFFYVGLPLTLPAFIGFLSALTQPRLYLAVLATLLTAVALAFCVYSLPHYIAPATVTLYLFAVEGLRYLWDHHEQGERAFVIAVCATVIVVSFARQSGSSAMNTAFRSPNQRELIAEQLNARPGKHIVLVSYDVERHYPGNELVHNGAEFGSQKIVWARSKGEGSDSDLCAAFPDRTFWRVVTDDDNFSFGGTDLCKRP